MSKLSDLLNPLPGSRPASPRPPKTSQLAAGSEQPQTGSRLALQHDAIDRPGEQGKDLETGLAHENKQSLAWSASTREGSAPEAASSSAAHHHPSDSPAEIPTAGSHARPPPPIEPSPLSGGVQKSLSPTLEQYHHASSSPTRERKSSLAEDHLTSTDPTLDRDDATRAELTSQGAQKSRVDVNTMSSLKSEPHEGDGDPKPDEPSFRHPLVPVPFETAAQSPRTEVKTEPSGTSPEPPSDAPSSHVPFDTPIKRAPSATPMADVATPKEVAGLRDISVKPPSSEASVSSRATSPAGAKAAKKKSAAPKSEASKRGAPAATKKPPSKKRKLEPSAKEDTPSSKRSFTPASSRASKTPAARGSKVSATPAQGHSSPAPADEDEDAAEVFCICRRPDNHTWMIGCDGGCEDWFHGACVKIKEEDGDLIDKYFCPNCEKEGKGNTTWKPMCRLEGCRQPARLAKGNASKYCSDEHGHAFMQQHLLKGRKRRKSGKGEVEEEAKPAIGGALSLGQLSALAKDAKDVEEFKRLGEGVLSPPPTISPERDGEEDVKMRGDREGEADQAAFNTEERTRIDAIGQEREQQVRRRQGFKDREKFVQLVRARAKRVLDELKGVKDICGYDSRLSWTEDEFLQWRESDGGRAAFDSNLLGPPAPEAGDEPDEDEHVRGVCQKKRCERHRQWWTLQLQDIRFEDINITDQLQRLSRDERDLKDRAKLRRVKEAEGDREGRTEVVS